MKKNVSFNNNAKKITISKRNKKDLENTSKDGIYTESHKNKIKKHSSYKEISLILNNNFKNNFKSKSKEKKRMNISKDCIDDNKKFLGSPIKSNTKKNMDGIERNSNMKAFINRIKNINGNINRFSNNKNIPKQKKKILIYNINSGLNSNYNLYTNMNSNTNNNNDNLTLSISSRMNEEKKLIQDEILELKLVNSRLKNEIQILIEKNKSLNEILEIKNKDIEILRNKNNKLYNETNDELILLKKKYENDIKILKKNYDKSISIIKSLINITIELCETILINGNNYNVYTNNNNNNNKSIKPKISGISGLENNSGTDNSLDIYESNNTFSTQEIINNNKEEEKKYNLLKQIKEIILEKINFIIKELNLILDTSFIEKIERIHLWNFQIKSYPTFSFLMSNIKKTSTNNNSINNISMNDEFDFSVSKSFYNHSQDGSVSPKFNNSLIKNNNNQLRFSKISNINNKIYDNFNESKTLFSSFNEVSNNKKDKEKENENKINIIRIEPRKIINILEYSMVDLNDGENNIINTNKDNLKNNINNIEKNNYENDEVEKMVESKINNFVLNSLSFNNELVSEKKENSNELILEKIDKEFNKNNNNNNEDKNENNFNFTLKNI